MLDGVPSPEEWLEWALTNNCPGIAIVDHGVSVSMYHAVRFKDMIQKYNKSNNTTYPSDAVIGIPGVELYVKEHPEDKGHAHITVWAVSTVGYFNLMKLSSLAYNDIVTFFGSVKPRVTYDMIQQYSEGLCFGTGCIASPMGKAIMAGNHQLAEEWYIKYINMFGDKLYVEFHPTDLTHDFDRKTGGFTPIQPNECSCDGNMQKAYNEFLFAMAEKHGGKPVPATDAHFILPEDKILQDVVLKAGNTNGWFFHQSYHQKKAAEIYHCLRTHLGDSLTVEKFTHWIENTFEVMDGAKTIETSFNYHLPKLDIPKDILAKTDDYNKQSLFLLMAKIKEHGRWLDDPIYIERFKKELDVILRNETLNFIPYFLMYEDICTYGRSQGIFQNIARGSAGGSLISYYLKIIHIDPIINKLPFERFLSHARIRAGSFPDIDLDLSNRSEVLDYLRQKYGNGFAQIATFQKMKTKNAIKDAMWCLYGKNRNDPEVVAICNQIPNSPQGVDESDFLYGYTDQEDTYHPGIIEQNKVVANFFEAHPKIEQMVKKLLGVVRGFGRHPSGFVISTVDISSERCPTMIMIDKKAGTKVLVTQYEAPMVDKIGLIKADILSVTTVETVNQCIELIKQRTGHDYKTENNIGIQEIYRLPEDVKVYNDFFNKKTDSSFQFNTPLIKGLVQDFCPRSRDDLSEFTALARPGALDAPLYDSTAAQFYIDVKNHKRELKLLHPDMANHTTNGAIVYQEQCMSFLVDIAGYSWEESDQIRGAIAKKKHAVIMATFDRIRESCRQRGWDDEAIETICQQIQAFSKYSFNRSHSRAYSELGYITMYLKHHYPLEWWTAVLNTTDEEDKLRHFVTVIGGMLSSPSLANTSNQFCIFKDKIFAPLSAIKGIGPNSVAELVNKGPFSSLEDYVQRINHSKVNVGHFSALIRARALDVFMDLSKPYIEARKELLVKYKTLRKCKEFDADLLPSSNLDLFLQERATNQVFNKSILESPDLIKELMDIWPGFVLTGNKGVPLKMGDVPVLRGLDIATAMVEKGATEQTFGFVLLYGGSEYRTGTSKKSGRKWQMLKIQLSDGVQEVEGVMWDKVLPMRYLKDSIVYVQGTVRPGYKQAISITISEIRRIIEE